MQEANHIVWKLDPAAINFGEFHLPFSISILGILAAFVFIYFGYQKLTPDKSSDDEELQLPALQFWGLVLGSFVLGQLLFLILPSPRISTVGPIQIRWYSLLFAASFVVGIWLTRKMFIHANRDPLEVDQLFYYVILGTVVGARLGHVFFYDPSWYLRHPGQILAVWEGGLASHGAAIGILFALYLFVRNKKNMSFLWITDRVVVVVAIAGAFIRIGNFMNSEIIGKPTELAWGIVFARRTDLDMVPRHPSMLYEALLCILVFVLLWQVYKSYNNDPPEGSLFGLFLTVLFGGRLFLEFLKHNQATFVENWFLNMGQWLSIPLIGIGLWLIFKKVSWKKSPQTTTSD